MVTCLIIDDTIEFKCNLKYLKSYRILHIIFLLGTKKATS